MTVPPPRVLPLSLALRSPLKTVYPSSVTAASGDFSPSHVSQKHNKVQSRKSFCVDILPPYAGQTPEPSLNVLGSNRPELLRSLRISKFARSYVMCRDSLIAIVGTKKREKHKRRNLTMGSSATSHSEERRHHGDVTI